MRRRQFLIAILLGLLGLAASGLRLRLAPVRQDNSILVTIDRAGGFAEQIEREITIPLEDQIAGLDGVSALHSLSRRGRASIEVRFDPLVSAQLAYIRVREAVERIEHLLPSDARRPRIERRLPDERPLFIIALAADSRLDFAEVGRRFGALEGSGRIAISGDSLPELVVQVAPSRLAASGVAIERLVQALQSDAAVGGFGHRQGVPFTLGSDERDASYLGRLDVDGVELGRLATVGERMAQPETISRVNGLRRVVLSVYPTDDTHPLRLCRQLRHLATDYPSAEVLYDYGRRIERSFGRAGLALLIAIVTAALGLKLFYALPLTSSLLPAVAALLAVCAAARRGDINLVSLLALAATLTLFFGRLSDRRACRIRGALFQPALLCGFVALTLVSSSFRELWDALLYPALAASSALSLTMLLLWWGIGRTRGSMEGGIRIWPKRGVKQVGAVVPGAWAIALLIAGSAVALAGLALIEPRPFHPDDRRAHFFRVIFDTGVADDEIDAAVRPLEEAIERLVGVRFVSALYEHGQVRFYVALERRSAAGPLRRLVSQQVRLIPEAFVLFADEADSANRLLLTLRGDDLLQLRRTAVELGHRIAALDGVGEVISDFAALDSALALNIDLERLGTISPGRVYSALYWALDQPVAAKRRGAHRENDIRVVVDRLSKPTPQDVMRLPIVAASGEQSRIGSVVSIGERPRVEAIRRSDRRRSVMLTIAAHRADRVRPQIKALIMEARRVSAGQELTLHLPSGRSDGRSDDRPVALALRRALLPIIAAIISWALLALRHDDCMDALTTIAIVLCAALPSILSHLLLPISLPGLVGLLTALVGGLDSPPDILGSSAGGLPIEGPTDRAINWTSAIGYLLWLIPLATIDLQLFMPFVLHLISVRATLWAGLYCLHYGIKPARKKCAAAPRHSSRNFFMY